MITTEKLSQDYYAAPNFLPKLRIKQKNKDNTIFEIFRFFCHPVSVSGPTESDGSSVLTFST